MIMLFDFSKNELKNRRFHFHNSLRDSIPLLPKDKFLNKLSPFGYIIKENTQKPIKEELLGENLINRDSQLKEVWRVLRVTTKFPLMYCGQMFGMGKTTFGQSIFNWNDAHIQDIFNQSFVASEDEKKILKNAHYLYIDDWDFITLCQRNADNLLIMLGSMVLAAGISQWTCKVDKSGEKYSDFSMFEIFEEFNNLENKPTIGEAILRLRKLIDGETADPSLILLLHFDEVGSLENRDIFPSKYFSRRIDEVQDERIKTRESC
jgi:hypothetical protein